MLNCYFLQSKTKNVDQDALPPQRLHTLVFGPRLQLPIYVVFDQVVGCFSKQSMYSWEQIYPLQFPRAILNKAPLLSSPYRSRFFTLHYQSNNPLQTLKKGFCGIYHQCFKSEMNKYILVDNVQFFQAYKVYSFPQELQFKLSNQQVTS